MHATLIGVLWGALAGSLFTRVLFSGTLREYDRIQRWARDGREDPPFWLLRAFSRRMAERGYRPGPPETTNYR